MQMVAGWKQTPLRNANLKFTSGAGPYSIVANSSDTDLDFDDADRIANATWRGMWARAWA